MFLVSCLTPAGGRDPESGDVDTRRIVRYPDSHQLFVGNLPHDIDENELKEFFMSTFSFHLLSPPSCSRRPPGSTVNALWLSLLVAAYGNVVELRINTKGVGGKLPNFGFVVFDDPDPVQRILGAKVEGACISISLPTLLWWWFGDTFLLISHFSSLIVCL